MSRFRTRRVLALSVLILFLALAIPGCTTSQSTKVYVITVDDTIGAGTADYVVSAIDRASNENAWLLIKLDTSGGLLSATKRIVNRMLEEDHGIVVWVTPQGSWAFSAGTYILLASTHAVMDEGTSIGAAQPRPKDEKTTLAMAEWIKQIASVRGRSASVAERFVTQNLTLGPENALAENVIDQVSSSLDNILSSLGIIHPEIIELEMSWAQRFLQVLSNPDVVMLLFLFGFFGVLAEITTPGIGIPGILGAICLILSFWGLGLLSLDYAGLALLGIGLLMLAYEILTPGFGIFGGGGIVALVLGLLMIGKEPWIQVVGNVILGLLLGLTVFLTFVLVQARRALQKRPTVGREELIGQFAVAVSDLRPRGLVKLKGELWSAETKTKKPIRKGEDVVVIDVRGNTLVVRRRKKIV